MSSAVHNLQKAIVEGKVPLTQLLRHTKLIAAKLNLADVEEWVELELNGYPEGKERPPYREVTADRLLVMNPYQGWQHVGDVAERCKVHQPIAEIEMLAQQSEVSFAPATNYRLTNSLGTPRGSQWPQRVTVSPNDFRCILEAVRNKLLEWTITLEKRGIKGEEMDFDEKEKQSAASMVFNVTNMQGNMGNVTNSQVNINDFSSVHQLLVQSNIPTKERHELENLLEDLKTAPLDKKPTLLARAEKWVTDHKGLLGAGTEILGKVIEAANKHH